MSGLIEIRLKSRQPRHKLGRTELSGALDQHGESMTQNDTSSDSSETKPSRADLEARGVLGRHLPTFTFWWTTSRSAQVVRGVLGGTLATLLALVAYVVIGMTAGPLVVGLPGLGVCAALGAAAGVGLRGLGSRGARITNGFLGGLVGSYFIQASVEAYPWGTLGWAIKGGALGAAFSLPVAFVTAALIELGLIALSWLPRRD